MTNDIFIDIKVFKDDIEKKKPCFLIGNGLCRYLCAPDWGRVIWKVMNMAVKDEKSGMEGVKEYLQDDFQGEAFNHPEIYTSFLIDRKTAKSRDTYKNHLRDFLIPQTTCALLKYALSQEAQILTPNFDYSIECALGFPTGKKGTIHFSHVKGCESTETYPYGEYASKEKRGKLYLERETAGKGDSGHYVTDSCSVWHIHGSVNHPRSILWGFEDYINAIIHLKELQSHSPNAKYRYAEPWEDGFVQKNSWLRLFFTKPLVIVGCGLNSEELFLRWLLLRRQRQITIRHDKNPNDAFQLPLTYYLDTHLEADKKPKLDKARLLYFKFLGIKVVRFKNYDELYDGPQWGTAEQ